MTWIWIWIWDQFQCCCRFQATLQATEAPESAPMCCFPPTFHNKKTSRFPASRDRFKHYASLIGKRLRALWAPSIHSDYIIYQKSVRSFCCHFYVFTGLLIPSIEISETIFHTQQRDQTTYSYTIRGNKRLEMIWIARQHHIHTSAYEIQQHQTCGNEDRTVTHMHRGQSQQPTGKSFRSS